MIFLTWCLSRKNDYLKFSINLLALILLSNFGINNHQQLNLSLWSMLLCFTSSNMLIQNHFIQIKSILTVILGLWANQFIAWGSRIAEPGFSNGSILFSHTLGMRNLRNKRFGTLCSRTCHSTGSNRLE